MNTISKIYDSVLKIQNENNNDNISQMQTAGSFEPNSTRVWNQCSQIFLKFLPFNCFYEGSIS